MPIDIPSANAQLETPTFQAALDTYLGDTIIQAQQELEQAKMAQVELATDDRKKAAILALLPKVWAGNLGDATLFRVVENLTPTESLLYAFLYKNDSSAAYIADLFEADPAFGEKLMGDTYRLVEFIASARGESLARLHWLKTAQRSADELDAARDKAADLQTEIDTVKTESLEWYRRPQQAVTLVRLQIRLKTVQASIRSLESTLEGMEPARVRAELEETYQRLAALAGLTLAAVTTANATTEPTDAEVTAAEVTEPLDDFVAVDETAETPLDDTDDVEIVGLNDTPDDAEAAEAEAHTDDTMPEDSTTEPPVAAE